MSTQTGAPFQKFTHLLDKRFDDYESLWSSLASTAEQCAVAMPEKSGSAAWKQSERDFNGVALTGSLSFIDQPSDRIFEFKLNPLKIEPTYRLARKFGHDRFFLLNIPSIASSDLPRHLSSDPNARAAILDWLVHSEHFFLGRRWRAFYVKNESTKKVGSSSQSKVNDTKRCYRVYLFAESGSDFNANVNGGEKDPRKFDHSPMTRKDLIDWLMPARENKDQRALKFFSRLALGQ